MALTAESKLINIQKSLNAYLYASLVTTASLQVHFVGDVKPFAPTGARWVQASVLVALRRHQYGRVGDATEAGAVVTGLLNLNCCELVAQRANRYSLATLRDTVRNYVLEYTTTIPIRDYDTGGTPIVGTWTVTDLTENQVSDGLGATDNGIAIINLSASGEYIEAY